jgi:hypothetical protein
MPENWCQVHEGFSAFAELEQRTLSLLRVGELCYQDKDLFAILLPISRGRLRRRWEHHAPLGEREALGGLRQALSAQGRKLVPHARASLVPYADFFQYQAGPGRLADRA